MLVSANTFLSTHVLTIWYENSVKSFIQKFWIFITVDDRAHFGFIAGLLHNGSRTSFGAVTSLWKYHWFLGRDSLHGFLSFNVVSCFVLGRCLVVFVGALVANVWLWSYICLSQIMRVLTVIISCVIGGVRLNSLVTWFASLVWNAHHILVDHTTWLYPLFVYLLLKVLIGAYCMNILSTTIYWL